MANWSNPALTSTYTDFLSELKARDTDLALQFDGTTSSNLATGTIRWNSTANRWQKWSGSAWAELTGTYALTALTTTGNASIGGTLAVTGATTLAAATATTPATGNNSTAVATTAYVRAQAYAPLASPALTGTPTVPTATVNTNTTQAASTAFVQAEIANDAPSKTGTGASGTWGISVSGNAATVTTNANLTGPVTSVGNGTAIADGAITNAMLATISTAGKVSGTAITSGNIDTSGELRITNSSPTVRLTESDGTATHSQTALARNNDQLLVQTRSSAGVFISNDYIIPADASGATDHIWRTADSERLRIDSSGRLLVGTSSALTNTYVSATAIAPAAQIEGNSGSASALSITRQTGAAANIILQRGVTGTPVAIDHAVGQVNFNGFDGTNFRTAAQITAEVDGTPGSNDMPGRLVFSTTADGASSPTERMRINSDGAVVISSAATPPDNEKFYVDGVSGFNRNSNGEIVRLHRSDTKVGSISVTVSATAYNTSSDYRLKENITLLDGAIARLNQLPVHRFNFIADPDTVVDGFIAHEAAAVVPECVTGEKDEVNENGDPVYQGIDQSKVVPLLTAALQEAIVMINALEARITALEA